MLFNQKPPYYFAHRGASAHAPENTLEAFQLAMQQGAKFIEFDVKLTSDHQVVVIHDQTVDRTTDGKGNVKRLSLQELKELDAGSWYNVKFRNTRIPTLSEVFESFGNNLCMNVELTNYVTPFDGLVKKVCDLVKLHGMESSVIFSSFYPTNLIQARKLLPTVPCGQLSFPGVSGWWQRSWGRLIDLQADHPFTSDVTGDFVTRSHQAGRLVHVWTVNDPDVMRRLWKMGVDGIFSDDPLMAGNVLSEFQ